MYMCIDMYIYIYIHTHTYVSQNWLKGLNLYDNHQAENRIIETMCWKTEQEKHNAKTVKKVKR